MENLFLNNEELQVLSKLVVNEIELNELKIEYEFGCRACSGQCANGCGSECGAGCSGGCDGGARMYD